MASAILMYFANRLSATFCARDSIQMKAPVTSLGWATGVGLGHDRCERGLADRKRIAPQVVAVQLNQVEGVEEYALVSAVVTDEIERGNAGFGRKARRDEPGRKCTLQHNGDS